ncbi:MAG: hypothetical protein IJ689_00635 [Alphaproteobacteria bacterium]|nr:hypothetical protein [Alphaproteobacteria bacterium]
MKTKYFFVFAAILFAAVSFCSCDRDDDPWDDYRPYSEFGNHRNTGDDDNNGNNNGNNPGNPGNGDDNGNGNGNENGNGDDNGNADNNGNGDNNGNSNAPTIVKLWEVVMRRSIAYPFQAYVMEMDNGNHYYLLRYRYNKDLHIGDRLSFKVSAYCAYEIEEVYGSNDNGGANANENDYPDMGQYLVASDPIEATVKGMFGMQMCTRLPIWPSDYYCIETTEGKLLFITPNKLNVELKPGDRFVYNVYTLFPNSILALKKL